jgi:hypothetical protein
MRDAAASGILAVWKRAAPRNRMREIFTSGSVGGLDEQSLVLPGHISPRLFGRRPVFTVAWGNAPGIGNDTDSIGRRPYSCSPPLVVNMAFSQNGLVLTGQNGLVLTGPWGDALVVIHNSVTQFSLAEGLHHRSLGHRPRNLNAEHVFGRRPYSTGCNVNWLNMAFGQT